jgi:hypothetical protein
MVKIRKPFKTLKDFSLLLWSTRYKMSYLFITYFMKIVEFVDAYEIELKYA